MTTRAQKRKLEGEVGPEQGQQEKTARQEERDQLRRENKELKLQMTIAVREKNEAVQENYELQQENHELKQQKDKAVQENSQHKGLLEKMRSKVECPVCLAVPRAGPVPMCPRGHFICSSCKAARERLGKQDCPSCRGPMGEARSLLATLVIENVKHECEHKDCEIRVDFKEYKRHKEACDFRPVLCPGTHFVCGKLMAFRDIKQHVGQCTAIEVVPESAGLHVLNVFKNMNINMNLTDTMFKDFPKDLMWPTHSFEFNSKSFFLLQQKNARGGIYMAEVVMLGSQEECYEYITEISIQFPSNQNSKPTFRFSHSPRPIAQDMWGDFTLTVTEKAILGICRKDIRGEHKEKNFFRTNVNIRKV